MPSAERIGASCFILNDTACIVGGRTLVSTSITAVWAYIILSDS